MACTQPALIQIFRQCPVGQGSHPSLAGDQLRNNGCQFGLAQTRRLDIGGVQESREYVQPLPFYRISNQDLVGQLFRFYIFVRSEEHTSELQSLMRISYAVFCLKKKKKVTQKLPNSIHIQKH